MRYVFWIMTSNDHSLYCWSITLEKHMLVLLLNVPWNLLEKFEFQKYPTVNQMNKEHLALSQIQLANTLPHSSTLTLLSDEASKCLDAYRIRGEWWHRSHLCSMTSTSDNIAKIIRNTISDLAATEHKYIKLVDVYGKDILP